MAKHRRRERLKLFRNELSNTGKYFDDSEVFIGLQILKWKKHLFLSINLYIV